MDVKGGLSVRPGTYDCSQEYWAFGANSSVAFVALSIDVDGPVVIGHALSMQVVKDASQLSEQVLDCCLGAMSVMQGA